MGALFEDGFARIGSRFVPPGCSGGTLSAAAVVSAGMVDAYAGAVLLAGTIRTAYRGAASPHMWDVDLLHSVL